LLLLCISAGSICHAPVASSLVALTRPDLMARNTVERLMPQAVAALTRL
jgi:hypothetical protein